MNLLKSFYISTFVTWLAVMSIFAFIQIARGAEPALSWLGLALSAFAPLTFFIKAFLINAAQKLLGHNLVGVQIGDIQWCGLACNKV